MTESTICHAGYDPLLDKLGADASLTTGNYVNA